MAKEIDGSVQWFHFFDGIFLGQWYPEWFLAKSMVLKRFTPLCWVVRPFIMLPSPEPRPRFAILVRSLISGLRDKID